ncbi:MAG: hypothetical protein AB1Z23_10755 [Eubacteriales bacterium]
MNCYKCKRTIDKIHVDGIDDNTLQSVLHHIEGCESCREYYNAMEHMISDLSSFEEQELPKGFHNKLHFALQREAETPQKSSVRFSSGLRAAAIGAFSIILIIAAVSILPRAKSNDYAPLMAKDEAAPADEEMMKAEMDMVENPPQEAEVEFEAASAPKEFSDSNSNELRDEDDGKDSSVTTEECNDFVCTYLSRGGSKVLVIDVEDVDEAYEQVMQFLPDAVLLPDSSWVIGDLEEPESYRQIRTLMTIEQVEYISEKIGLEYARNLEIYSTRRLEYDDMDKELAGIQEDLAYLYIVLY